MTFIHVGMSYFSLLSLFKTSNVYIIKVLYNATSTFGQIWNHFPFKLSEVRVRHSFRLGGTSDLYPSFFAISNVLNDEKPKLLVV